MRNLVALVLVATVIGIGVSTAALAEDEPQTGRLHRIDVKATHPTAYHLEIGDLVQCYMDFPIVPEQIVDALKVDVAGAAVASLGVVSTSLPKILGSGQISAYFLPRVAGTSKITITPVVPGQKVDPIRFTLRVQDRRER